jgi:hypothetical protein
MTPPHPPGAAARIGDAIAERIAEMRAAGCPVSVAAMEALRMQVARDADQQVTPFKRRERT